MGSTQFTHSPFSPAAARKTSVCLLRNRETGDHRLVTSISTRKSTEVLRINLRTGRLELENDAVSESSYENESEALAQLQDRGFETAERGSALLGYVVAGPCAGVLLATRSKPKATLPGGHTIHAVTDSQWVIVPLLNEAADAAQAAAMAGLPPPKADAEFWRALQQFTLNNAHYYCETADISRPFPSPRDPREPSPEFVWNSWLRQPLVELGLYDHCPALLQGAAESSTLQHPGGGRFTVCLLSRRSRRHPGTRYIARGLNSLAGPGNEIECELLTWTHPEQHPTGGAGAGAGAQGSPQRGEPLKWARAVWRRGTVPIWWGVQLQSLAQGLQAEVYVRGEHPYRGTASYFRNVQRQHAPHPQLAPPPPDGGADAAAAGGSGAPGEPGGEGWTLVGGDGRGAAGERPAAAAAGAAPEDDELLGRSVPVTCINLLHANPKKASELMLSSHFQDAMRHVRRRLGGDAPIRVVNFDWHGNMGRLSEEKAVEGFWSLMEPFVKQTGFAAGWMEPAGAADASACVAALPGTAAAPQSSPADAVAVEGVPAAAAAAAASAWPPGWRMRWSAQQAGVLRFNCADSLDRTNAATCFAMLPVLQEQLRLLGIPLECSVPPATAALLRGGRGHASAGDVVALAGQAAGPALDELAAALPEGWEVRHHEGRPLYIDHINRTTQWTPPPPPAPSPGGRPLSGGRPPSGAALGARVMQSASGMLARLQRQAGGPTGGETSAGDGGARHTPLLSLDRRPSPPRSGAQDASWARRSGSSGSLAGAGLQEGGAPDAALSPSPSTSAVAAAAEAGDRDPLRPWAFFDYDIDAVRERLLREAVDSYVEMFRVHGDIHSFLYTGSPAMHSHVLSLVVQGGKGYGASSGVGKLQNLRVAVQRRWNNTVSDASRQQAMELFLGLRIQDAGGQRGYFPGLKLLYHDSTQEQLGGLEACEQAASPPAGAHSQQPSLAAPLAAGVAAMQGEPAPPPLQQQQQRQQGTQPGPAAREEAWEEGDEDDRAHAVAGVPVVQHDGVLGVRQSLLDLEPLPEDGPPEARQGQRGGSPAAHDGGASWPHAISGEFDPLGAMGDAELAQPGQQQRGELIDLDGGSGAAAERAPGERPAPAAEGVRTQLDDLLL